MNDELMLDVDQAGELKAALRRSNWTNAEIKKLCEGDTLAQMRSVLLGRAEIRPIEYLIDYDAPVFVPKDWEVLPDAEQLPNRVRGQMKFDLTKIKLHLADGQKNGKWIGGNKLREKLAKEPVYTAHVLDYVLELEHQHLIPEEWKGKCVFFWGTTYRNSDGYLCVRCLDWGGGRWCWDCSWLDDGWDNDGPAAVSAS